MRTLTSFESGVTYLHHGDYSSGMEIPDDELHKLTDSTGRVRIPLEDILVFVGQYLRARKISELEQMGTDELMEKFFG